MTPKNADRRPLRVDQDATTGGLPVRTNLRAGLAWDDLDDQAAALWQQLSTSVSNAVSNLSGSSSDTSSTAS
jgi:hypothetical protein